MKIRQMGAEIFYPDGQIDSRLSQFCERSKQFIGHTIPDWRRRHFERVALSGWYSVCLGAKCRFVTQLCAMSHGRVIWCLISTR